MKHIQFDQAECGLFSEKRSKLRKYNADRKLVADKFEELGRQLKPRLKTEGYKLDYRVSKHYPNPRNNWKVPGIWLAFTGSEQYYNWAQLNVGLYYGGLSIGIEVPRYHRDNPVARRLLINSATLVANSINKLGEGAGIDFSPDGPPDWGLSTPIDPKELASAAGEADYGTWISMGEWYNASELPKAPNPTSRALTVFKALRPVFSIMTASTTEITPRVRVVDEHASKRDLLKSARKFLQGNGSEPRPFNVWREGKTINWPIKTSPTVIRRPQARMIAGLNLKPKKIHGEWVQFTPGLATPKYSQLKKLRSSVANLVKLMGGNPATVKVMITDEHTDGRILEEQLFVNGLLTDKSLAYWGIVAARELAGLTTKSYYPHVRRMSTLLELLITNEKFLALLSRR